MPISSDTDTALNLLQRVQQKIQEAEDLRTNLQINNDINTLISVLESPVFKGVLNIQDSLKELKKQLVQHPSILPVDFDITTAGELVLNVPPVPELSPDQYDPGYEPEHQKYEFDAAADAKLDQVVSPESSPEENLTQPPITTPTYAIEFQRAIEAAAQGRSIHTIQLCKPDGSSLGFSVVGLKSELKGELGIYVQEIQALGIAARDGRLQEGDQILAIDGQPLDSNISHQQAISILQKARGLVELVVARGQDSEGPEGSTTVPSPSPAPSLLDRSPSAVSDTSKAGSDMVLNTEWAQVEVIDLINDGSGLGFGIIGGRSTGVVIKTILPGGLADRDGRLQSGDHILQIGDINLRGMGSEQVAAVLRQSGTHVRLIVARPIEPTSPDFQSVGNSAPIVPTKVLMDPEELERQLGLLQNGFPDPYQEAAMAASINGMDVLEDDFEGRYVFDQQNGEIGQTQIELHPQPAQPDITARSAPSGKPDFASVANVPQSLPLGSQSIPIIAHPVTQVSQPTVEPRTFSQELIRAEGLAELPEMETFEVELTKDVQGLGITIAGYVCEKEELSGIFVKSINKGSAADLCGKIQVNDQIVEVDSQSLHGFTNHQAVDVLRNTGQVVQLRLARYLRGPKYEQLQQAIANSEMKPPTPSTPPLVKSLPQVPDTDKEEYGAEQVKEVGKLLPVETVPSPEVIEARNEEVELADVEIMIDENYSGAMNMVTETAIQTKWAKILGQEYEIVVAQLSKFKEGGGLGISLEGTVDVEDGREVRPHHYIRSILPDGPVGVNRKLQSGDELLEVNGKKLLGLNHVEVVKILKELPVDVRMVCARRPGEPPPSRPIDTSQDRAAFAARNILGGSLQNLIPATDRLVKAKSDGSLASTATATTDTSFSKMKSRSLEPLTGLAMWSSEPQIIELIKGDRGLGFSILDYQDPMNPNETVIVIRSLVPGGVAQQDGSLIPGDRLMFVNDINLENASLDVAVQALKGAEKGVVQIGVAKPLPLPDGVTHSQ